MAPSQEINKKKIDTRINYPKIGYLLLLIVHAVSLVKNDKNRNIYMKTITTKMFRLDKMC